MIDGSRRKPINRQASFGITYEPNPWGKKKNKRSKKAIIAAGVRKDLANERLCKQGFSSKSRKCKV